MFTLDDFIHNEKRDIAVLGTDPEPLIRRLTDMCTNTKMPISDVEPDKVMTEITRRLNDPKLRITVLPELCEVRSVTDPTLIYYVWAFTLDGQTVYRLLGGSIVVIPKGHQITALNALETYRVLNTVAETTQRNKDKLDAIDQIVNIYLGDDKRHG